jgi:hypothetical protein
MSPTRLDREAAHGHRTNGKAKLLQSVRVKNEREKISGNESNTVQKREAATTKLHTKKTRLQIEPLGIDIIQMFNDKKKMSDSKSDQYLNRRGVSK